MDIKALLELRAKNQQEMQNIVAVAGTETRALTKEEQDRFDELEDSIKDLDSTIERMKKMQANNPVVPFEPQARSGGNDYEEIIGDQLMTDAECRKYSFAKLARYLADPNKQHLQKEAEFELEISKRAQERYGKEDAKGVYVPLDEVLTRSVSATAGNGAELISHTNRADMLIEMLKPYSAFLQKVNTFSGLKGDVSIPRHISGAVVSWISEDGSAPESSPEWDSVDLTAKTMTARTYVTRKMMKQSDVNLETFIRNQLLEALGQELDRAIVYGTGGDQPTGIMNQTGVPVVSMGTDGGPLNHNKAIEMETIVAVDDAIEDNLLYVSNSKVRGYLKTTEKAAGSGRFLMDEKSKELNGYGFVTSRKMLSNRTKGNGENLSDVLFGNFNDIILGLWGVIDLTANPYKHSEKGGVEYTAFQDADIIVRHPESFVVAQDVDTAAV